MESVSKKILIVDDDDAFRRLLAALLRDDGQLETAASGEEALEKTPRFLPDLVLLDIMMPGIDGYETCRRLKTGPHGERLHVIMVSARSSREEQALAFEVGADDYIVKPIDPHELRSRVQLHFRLCEAISTVESVQTKIESHDSIVKRLTERRVREIVATQDVAVFTLAKVSEFRDRETGDHLIRMRSYSQLLAERLARSGPYADQIDETFLDDLYRSSLLHDIGKIGISDAILLKPGRLTPDEFEIMKQHSIIGANILDQAMMLSQCGGFLAMAGAIARFHHERFDGTGYPAALQGEEIPLPARIVAVADVYDALISVRPYKPAFPAMDAREMILCESGRHFDPVIVEAFRECFEEFLKIRKDSDEQPETVGAMAFVEHELAFAGA